MHRILVKLNLLLQFYSNVGKNNKMEYTKGFIICLILAILCNIHSDAQRTQFTYNFQTSLNQNVPVNLACSSNKVVAIDSLTVTDSDNTCRTNLYLWLSDKYLGESGRQRTIPAATQADCVNNDAATITYSCVDSSQIINICGARTGNITDGELVYLRSPAFPDQYVTNKNCEKFIFVNKRAKIQILFMDMHARDEQGCYDSLHIYQSYPDIPDPFRDHTLCGNDMFDVFDGATPDMDPDRDYYKLSLTFYTDAVNRGAHRGFIARIELVTYCLDDTCENGQVCMNDYQLEEPYCVDGDGVPVTSTTIPTTATTMITMSTTATEQVPARSDDCLGVVCENGGNCVDDFRGFFICDCQDGWEGVYCLEASSTARILGNLGLLALSLIMTLLRH